MPVYPNKRLSRRSIQFLILLSLSILFGLAWFLLLFDRYPLYVSNVNYIYSAGGDLLQHQLGWEWFRQEPWRFPLGRIEAYGYPFGTYITFMDSIPLFAIPFKVLSPWLGDNFQYIGIWNLASIVGQFLVGMLILREFSRSYINILLGAILLVFSPPMIFRFFYHDSLTAHWIILAAIWLIILEYRNRLGRFAWIVLFALAMLVHLYFVAMLLPLWVIGLFLHYSKGEKKWMVWVDILAVIAVILLLGYGTGLFSLNIRNLGLDGYGLFSWNLNGFINPSSIPSSFLKRMALGDFRQYEGFSYLGMGNLLILPTATFLFLHFENLKKRAFIIIPFMIVAISYCLFAVTQKAFLGDRLIWEFRLPDLLYNLFFSMFRASGRFIWPVFYFLVLFGITSILRYFRFPAVVLVVALLVQSSDLSRVFEFNKYSGFVSYDSPLESEFWKQAVKSNRHIILFPANRSAENIYEPFAILARQNKLTLNWGYFSRADNAALEKYGNQAWEDLKTNRADAQTIYIIYDPEWDSAVQANLSGRMLVCQVDGFDVVLSSDNGLTLTNMDLTRFCTMPTP
jgi:hypothetical protein